MNGVKGGSHALKGGVHGVNTVKGGVDEGRCEWCEGRFEGRCALPPSYPSIPHVHHSHPTTTGHPHMHVWKIQQPCVGGVGVGVQPSVRSCAWEVKMEGESVGGGHPGQSKGSCLGGHL